MIKTKLIKKFLAVLLFTTINVFAEIGEGSNDLGAEPPPAAPINHVIPIVTLLALGYAFRICAKRN